MDLRSKCFGIAGIANKDLNGQGASLTIAEKPDDDLLFSRLAIAVVAPGSQGVVVTFQIAAGNVIEEKIGAAVGMKMFKEALFDKGLVLGQPSQVWVELIFVKRVQAKDVAGGMGASQTDGAEAGTLLNGPCDDLPQSQSALAVATQGVDDAGALSQRVKHPDSAEAKPLAQDQRIWSGRLERVEIFLMFESQLNGFDFLVGASGEIGDSAVFDFSILAVGLAKQDAAIGFAVDRGFGAVEIHSGHILCVVVVYVNGIVYSISGYKLIVKYTYQSFY